MANKNPLTEARAKLVEEAEKAAVAIFLAAEPEVALDIQILLRRLVNEIKYHPSGVTEKPEGFDLRDKRSEKTDDPRLWTGQDALYDASLRLKSHPGEQVLVIWWETLPDNKRRFSFRNSCTSTAEANNLLLYAISHGIKGQI